MALRGLARQLLPALGSAHHAAPALSMASSQQLRCMGGGGHDEHHDDDHPDPSKPAPSVFDKLVEFYVIDLKGKRRVVKGIVGKRLSEALVEAKLPSTYFFPNMGFYTQHIVDAHVFLPRHLWHVVPNINPNGEEADAIVRMFRDIVQDYQKDTSYFASYVRITHDLEGATIGIGPIKPWILHSNWYFDGVHKEHAALVSAQGVIWG